MFTAVLFIIVSNWKQPKWMNRLWCSYGNKTEPTVATCNRKMEKAHRQNVEQREKKEPDTKGYVLNDFIYIKLKNRQAHLW